MIVSLDGDVKPSALSPAPLSTKLVVDIDPSILVWPANLCHCQISSLVAIRHFANATT